MPKPASCPPPVEADEDDRLLDILERWEEYFRRGEEIPPESLGIDDPVLLDVRAPANRDGEEALCLHEALAGRRGRGGIGKRFRSPRRIRCLAGPREPRTTSGRGRSGLDSDVHRSISRDPCPRRGWVRAGPPGSRCRARPRCRHQSPTPNSGDPVPGRRILSRGGTDHRPALPPEHRPGPRRGPDRGRPLLRRVQVYGRRRPFGEAPPRSAGVRQRPPN